MLASDVIKSNKKTLTANLPTVSIPYDLLVLPIMHVNVTKGGFFSVYDKVHYLDARTFKPVIIS